MFRHADVTPGCSHMILTVGSKLWLKQMSCCTQVMTGLGPMFTVARGKDAALWFCRWLHKHNNSLHGWFLQSSCMHSGVLPEEREQRWLLEDAFSHVCLWPVLLAVDRVNNQNKQTTMVMMCVYLVMGIISARVWCPTVYLSWCVPASLLGIADFSSKKTHNTVVWKECETFFSGKVSGRRKGLSPVQCRNRRHRQQNWTL